jgi:outer membrane protein
MKTRIRQIIILILISVFPAQLSAQEIKLITCIDSALVNKGNIQAVRTDIEIAKLQTSSAYLKYLPDLALSYNYRYNAIIPSQIIPVGQFNPVPTDEKRPIKFGTTWQQNSGISLYQPIIDFSIKSRVEESRINEKLKNVDAAAAERDLIMEVITSYTNIWLSEEQLRSSVLDTLRTFSTKELVTARAEEGKVMKTEVNTAVLNHNNALSNYFAASSSLTREKIYMSFLTGIPLETLLDNLFDFSLFSDGLLDINHTGTVPDSIPSVKNLKLKTDLLEQQQRSERMNKIPTIGFEGFLGANQYTDTFDPFESDKWYGSSYLGLSLRFRILSGNSTSNRVNQLKLEAKGVQSKLNDEIRLISNQALRLAEEIRQIKYQADITRQNISLYEENIELSRERFDEGQINAYDLLAYEIDLQKEILKYNEKQAELLNKQIELINNSGSISEFINGLRK